MTRNEINAFEITNLKELSCDYYLYTIKGLPRDPDNSSEYEKRFNILITKLSFKTWSPCVRLVKNGVVYIAQPEGYDELPDSFDIIGGSRVIIERLPNKHYLNFSNLDANTIHLAIRFLQSQLSRTLANHPELWQPKSRGGAIFLRTPDSEFRKHTQDLDLFRGFCLRVAELPNYRIGIFIDQSSKYVCRYPLPSKITHDEFRKLKGKSVVYEYGKHLYEIDIHELSDLNAYETIIKDGVRLYDDVLSQYKNIPKTTLVASLKSDCAVLVYRNNRDEVRNMPSAMCRLTVDTREVKTAHKYSIMPPHRKHFDIISKIKNYLRGISFNSVQLRISEEMHVASTQSLPFPVLLFGNDRTLDINHLVSNNDFGRQKETLLLSPEAGFFRRKQLGPQYVFIPKSVHETWGPKFINDLSDTFFFVYKEQYAPKIISYDDSQKSISFLSKNIIQAASSNKLSHGYCVVMVTKPRRSSLNKEDFLANTVIQKLGELKLTASVIHTSVSESCLYQRPDKNGNRFWDVTYDLRGKYNGYLKNVVINKILLLNDVRPFILKDRLNSDLVIGIDRKSNYAGFTFVTSRGEEVLFVHYKTKRNEKLRSGLIKEAIKSFIKDRYSIVFKNLPKNILIHRDGILFEEEKAAIEKTIVELKTEKVVDADCKCTYIEIRKSHMLPLRLFRIEHNNGRNSDYITNPFIGTIFRNGSDAFIATTGRPYAMKGTSNPLCLSYKGGALSFDKALNDTFALTHLTWTKVDYCSRVPLTIRFGDIGLRDVAGEYDEDEFEYGTEEGDMENE